MRRQLPNWLLGCIVLVAAHGCGGPASSPFGVRGPSTDDAEASSDSSGATGSASGVAGGADSGMDGEGRESDGAAGSSSSGSGPGPTTGDRDGGPRSFKPLALSDIGQAVLVSSRFYFTEGPVWSPRDGVLYFTDINAQQNGAVGAIYRLRLPATIDVLLEPDGNADGLALDRRGDIIAAGFASRGVWRLSGGTRQVLSGCASGGTTTCYQGQEVNTPDDVTVRSDGVIYFTDPTFASGGQGFPTQNLALASAQGVYRMGTDGTLHREDTSASGPNGVNLSPDEKRLYVAYTLANSVARFDVAVDGSLSGKQTFATGTTLADSMCVDAGGNVYVGTSSGLAVFSPEGQALGTLSAAGQIATNCAFGGPDQRTLFITSRAQSTLVGAPVANDSSVYRIDNMPIPGIPGQN